VQITAGVYVCLCVLQSALASEAAAVAAARSQQVCVYADHSRCICECLCVLQSALASEAAAVAAARSQQVCVYADHSRCICECLCVAVCTCQ